jgi:hemolysin D
VVEAVACEPEVKPHSLRSESRHDILIFCRIFENISAQISHFKRQKMTERALFSVHTTARQPIDGTVQQLVVHTVGGVVSPAQAVLVVVPDDAGLVVEAQVANKDVGFVHAGQAAEVKVEAFTFTRYGLIHGIVVGVSRDAVIDDRAGPTVRGKRMDSESEDTEEQNTSPNYTAHIELGQTELITENGPAKLEAGMMMTAEIKTGRRSVISYLLSPLQRYAHEGIRER